ncbi:hypothetical protein HY989_04670 [Candidatus Micrarchaeota archaeon]|nr:hypothetical protein [Candidatus Micrarchaeota archaeon]
MSEIPYLLEAQKKIGEKHPHLKEYVDLLPHIVRLSEGLNRIRKTRKNEEVDGKISGEDLNKFMAKNDFDANLHALTPKALVFHFSNYMEWQKSNKLRKKEFMKGLENLQIAIQNMQKNHQI